MTSILLRLLGVLNELSSDINGFINNPELQLTPTIQTLLEEAYKLFNKLTSILGLKLADDKTKTANQELVKDLMNYILELREDARNDQNYSLADKIRDDLKEMGIKVEDSPHGVEWEIAKEDHNES